MATPCRIYGPARSRACPTCLRGFGISRCAATLLELLVVLFIIGIMFSLLFPALQAARARVDVNVCQNNVRQLGYAVRRYIDAKKRFPAPNHWTIDVLKYIEEDNLASTLPNVIPQGMKIGRPKLFSCPAQSEVYSSVVDVRVCHYTLVVDRPVPMGNVDQIRWDLNDREDLSRSEGPLDPWYIGPDISFTQQGHLYSTKMGPHPSGTFYDRNGQVRGADSY